jgi:hypothetical protein
MTTKRSQRRHLDAGRAPRTQLSRRITESGSAQVHFGPPAPSLAAKKLDI